MFAIVAPLAALSAVATVFVGFVRVSLGLMGRFEKVRFGGMGVLPPRGRKTGTRTKSVLARRGKGGGAMV